MLEHVFKPETDYLDVVTVATLNEPLVRDLQGHEVTEQLYIHRILHALQLVAFTQSRQAFHLHG